MSGTRDEGYMLIPGSFRRSRLTAENDPRDKEEGI